MAPFGNFWHLYIVVSYTSQARQLRSPNEVNNANFGQSIIFIFPKLERWQCFRGRICIFGTDSESSRPGKRSNCRHRSEEHTSELQSLAYLVCRLLLEKKK